MKKNSKIKNIAKIATVNLITATRIVGSIALIPLFLKFGGLVASGVLAGVFLTDLVDGFLARKWNVSTFFGATLDAVSDKLIGITSLVALLSVTKLALLPILMEVGNFSINYLKYKEHQNVHSFFSGKLKTAAISIGVVLSFLLMGLNDIGLLKSISKSTLIYPLLLGMVPFQAVSLTQYIYDYKKQKEISDEEEQKISSEERLEQIKKEKAFLEERKKYYLETKKSFPFDHELYEEKKNDPELSTEVKAYFKAKKETFLTRKRIKK